MAYLVRAIVVVVAALYLWSDVMAVAPDGVPWVVGLSLLWVAAFLVLSRTPLTPVPAWGAALAALACIGLSWWLAPSAEPPLGQAPLFSWPGAATVGAGAVAGLVLVAAGSWVERLPAVVIGAGVVAAAFVDPVTRSLFMLDTGLILACSVTIAAVAIAQRHRIDAERQVAIAQERARLADELHDRIAHEVTGIVVLAQGSAALARNGPTQQPLELIEASGLRAMEHIRAIVGRSGPPTGARSRGTGEDAVVVDVTARLTRLVEDFAATATARVSGPGTVAVAVTPPVWDVVERTVTEALTNVRRHASSARHVRVHLTADDSTLTLWVTDDGDGGGLGTGGGSGLRRLLRRARAVGGDLGAAPEPTGGWQVRLRVPAAPLIPTPDDSGRSDA